jgi:manganese/iron transport system permease protein
VVASVRAVGTVLVIALLIVPAAAARAVSDRLTVIVPVAALLGALGGWAGLAISYDASLRHGLGLASGGTVVLVLVALHLAALTAAAAGRRFHAARRHTTRGAA